MWLTMDRGRKFGGSGLGGMKDCALGAVDSLVYQAFMTKFVLAAR